MTRKATHQDPLIPRVAPDAEPPANFRGRSRYVRLFDLSPLAYIRLDQVGRIMTFNAPAAMMLGAGRRSCLRGHAFADFVTPDSIETWRHYLEFDVSGPDKRGCELQLRRADGDVLWARVTGKYATAGEAEVLQFALEDITARKLAEVALLQKDRYQRALIDNFPFLVWLKDTESRLLAVNDTFARTFGAESPESLVGKTDFDLLPAETAAYYLATDQEVLASRKQLTLEEEIPREGESRWYEVFKAPVLDDRGGLLGTVGFSRDITTRKKAEATLRHLNDWLEDQVAERTAEAEARALALVESERFFRATIDALPSNLCVLDDEGRIVAVNKAWRNFATANEGDPDRLCEGADYLAVCDAAAVAAHETASATATALAIREILAGKRTEFTQQYECSAPTKLRWYSMTVSRFADEGPARLVVVHDDITESKLLATEQRETARRLKRLAAHLQSVREEQSAKIAREIHDELGGTLTILKLTLHTTVDALPPNSPLFAKLEGMVEQVNSALQTIKRISTDLRPAMLDSLGLAATIRWYADRFSSMTGIAVETKIPEDVRLSTGSSIGVFRIVQESLTNVAKHSGATRVKITLIKHKDDVILRMRDNGIGLPEDHLHRRDSFGVIGMLERAQHLGGKLTLTGAGRNGTQLTLRIPMDGGDAPDIQGDDPTCIES